MKKLEDFLFYTGVSILFLCIFLTFLFFTPKKVNETENFILLENMTLKQMQDLSLNLIEEGDIVLIKPKSFADSYKYDLKRGRGINDKVTSFFWYNLFDKIIINSMGDTYWHIGVYTNDGIINSLSLDIHEDDINKIIEYDYIKVLNVKTSGENKKLAIKRAEEHLKNQDIYYSLKNGLIIVFLESTNSKRIYEITDNELVCSSYIASIYREVDFDDKPFTHITPVDIEFSDNVETKFLINETGFFVRI